MNMMLFLLWLLNVKDFFPTRIFLTKMESCQRSMEYSRAVRERRSMMYAKLKPIETQKRALSSPGIHSTQYQADPRNKSLAAETMQSIHVFEESLKKRLPSIGIVHSQSTSTITERPANPVSHVCDIVVVL